MTYLLKNTVTHTLLAGYFTNDLTEALVDSVMYEEIHKAPFIIVDLDLKEEHVSSSEAAS